MTSLIITIAMTVLTSILAFWLAVVTIGTAASGPKPVPPIGVGVMVGGIVLVIIGLVLAIVAIATRRGRAPGIAGLIIGLLSWPLASVAGLFGYLTTL